MKYAITLLVIGLFSLSAMARMPDASEQVNHLTTLLDLNDDQAAQVTSIISTSHDKAMALMQQLADLREQTDTDIKAVLTSEQAAKFDAMQQRHQERGNHPPERF